MLTPAKPRVLWLIILGFFITDPLVVWVHYETNILIASWAHAIEPNQRHLVWELVWKNLEGLIYLIPIAAAFFWFALREYPGSVSFFAFNPQRPVWATTWSVMLGGYLCLVPYSFYIQAARLHPLESVQDLVWCYVVVCARSSLMHSTFGQRKPKTQTSNSGSTPSSPAAPTDPIV